MLGLQDILSCHSLHNQRKFFRSFKEGKEIKMFAGTIVDEINNVPQIIIRSIGTDVQSDCIEQCPCSSSKIRHSATL